MGEIAIEKIIMGSLFGAGAIQGFILGGILFVKKTKVPLPNRLLAFINFCFSIILIGTFYDLFNLYHQWPYLLIWPSLFWLLLPPSLYLNIATLLGYKYKLKLLDLLHILPILIMIFLWREVFFLSATERYLFLGNPDNFFNTPKRFYLQRMYTAQGLIYISYSIYLIRRFKKINLWRWTMFSNRQISFLLYAFVGMFVFVLIVDGSAMFRASRDLMPYQLWYSLPLVTCAFVYTISILILNNSSLFIKGVSLRKPTYKSKELPQTEVTYYLNELRELMEQEHIYLNPELTLSDISSRLGIKPRQLSKILKVHLKSNFYDYVNNYRINKTKEMFAEGKQKEWNLFSIALDSGFNSKSTFNRIFKKKTGYTPSEYISTIKV